MFKICKIWIQFEKGLRMGLVSGGGGGMVVTTPSHIQAKLKREVNRIGKCQREMEEKYRVSERKNMATQRGIISLLGNDVYLDPGIKHASVLYGQNIPGFCYRRNGEARRPCSIYESKTTRVIHTLDGREEILEEEASNVVSDSPLLDEILSSPQVLPILCDLRTTALLGKNPELLQEFVEGYREETHPIHLLFPDNEDPFISLKRYRAVLIQDLFDAIRIRVELRLNSAVATYNPPPHSGNPPGNPVPSDQGQASADTWHQVLMNKLQVLASGEEVEHSQLEVPNPETPGTAVSYWKVNPISSVPELVDSGGSPHPNNSCRRKSPNPAESEAKALEGVLAGLKALRRAEFEATVRVLIGEVNDVVALGKMIREVRRKNPCRAHCSTGLLEKLLEKEVFTSLNVKYCSILQEEGGLGTLEFQECLASGQMPELSEKNPDGTQGTRLAQTPSYNFEQVLDKFKSSTRAVHGSSKVKAQGQLKTRTRLCCPACKAKLRQGYEKFRERDEKYQKEIEERGREPNGSLMREIERISEEVAGIHPLENFDLLPIHPPPSEHLRTIHLQDSPLFLELDDSSFTRFPLSLSLTGIPRGNLLGHSLPVGTSPPEQGLRLFPDLETPLSYAPSPVPFTVPLPSPGQSPPITTKGSKRSSLQQRRKAGEGGQKGPPTSWTLKVSRFDLFRLRHELQRVAMEERMRQLSHHLSMQNGEDSHQKHHTNPVA